MPSGEIFALVPTLRVGMQARTLRVLHRRAVQTGIPTLSVGTREILANILVVFLEVLIV
jgi:hypothetical protein